MKIQRKWRRAWQRGSFIYAKFCNIQRERKGSAESKPKSSVTTFLRRMASPAIAASIMLSAMAVTNAAEPIIDPHLAPIALVSQGDNGSKGSDWYVVGNADSGSDGKSGGAVAITQTVGLIDADGRTGISGISRGGNGGKGGSAYGLGGRGGDGGNAGNGGEIIVTLGGTILANGADANGIYALSQGGNGGNGGDGYSATYGGGGTGGAGGNGGAVKVTTDANSNIATSGNGAIGIYAASISGNGGAGGDGGGIYGGGGAGSSSGQGGSTEVSNNGTISTSGKAAYGIFAQSVGGFAGSGGSGGGIVGYGGGSTTGGDGGTVSISNIGTITTGNASDASSSFSGSHTIFAQSIGGGGGSAGTGAGIAGVGGSGSYGGDAGTVTINNSGALTTYGTTSRGIMAQSIGGGGGDGGVSAGLVSVGGSGSVGGNGGNVTVNNQKGGCISTQGERSDAIFAQSIGGGGGNGGASLGSISVGGSGKTGGNGATVSITNNDALVTKGTDSRGILAQSIGGGGGNGGGSLGLGMLTLSVGGNGEKGGDGGKVIVVNNTSSSIWTEGERSHGIQAQSIGGGGGNGGFSIGASGGDDFALTIALGGQGKAGGSGQEVDVINNGSIKTEGNDAYGILAQSIGGGGGSGGFSAAVSGSIGISGSLAIGGNGSAGGNGAAVKVNNTADISSSGTHSNGILVQSTGGGGGDGGFSLSAALGQVALPISIGGSGSSGGNGGAVDVLSSGNIETKGEISHAVVAQSIGGGGGSGGFSITAGLATDGALSVGLGGKGGLGGIGGDVNVEITKGTVQTSGNGSYGISAQSIGGGGGSGGFSGGLSASLGDVSVGLTIGGSGGKGGSAGKVNITSDSNIITQGDNSVGIFAQSIGGGGGDGGFGLTASFSKGVSAAVAIGGSGGDGGNGGAVMVTSNKSIQTHGEKSDGITAQSIGGGGGNGGFSATGTITTSNSAGLGVSVGGSGGKGGAASTVTVSNTGTITTVSDDSLGIRAQSIGGGGGNGAFSFSGSFGGKDAKELSVGVGGSGGDGGAGGAVVVKSNGVISTSGSGSQGILAQSIGGGGGTGGSDVSIAFSAAGAEKESMSLAASVSIGGQGGSGNVGADTTVTVNDGEIRTTGSDSHGIQAQSIGGGGGNGGFSYTVDLGLMPSNSQGTSIAAGVSVGGSGGKGGTGGTVTVTNNAAITTQGDRSYGISAQSIGGGGGDGGKARAFTLIVGSDESTTPVGEKLKVSTWSLKASVGGNGGSGNDGGTVSVTNSGSMQTEGTYSHGIIAQSIGGGGGNGGEGILGSDSAADLLGVIIGKVGQSHDISVAVGGNAGSQGNGGTVTVENTGSIVTKGYGANGIIAQSVGGGGGIVQNYVQGTNTASGGSAVIGFSGKIGLGGAGGSAGDGGTVSVKNSGNIETFGDGAIGILAQSVGGGGGIAGNVDRCLPNYLNLGYGLGFARDGGGGGSSGAVTVTNTSNITTHGDGAIGIFAQSVGGGGGMAGDLGIGPNFAGSVGGSGDGNTVTVLQKGNITTYGAAAHGILAQSSGGVGVGDDVQVTLGKDSLIQANGTDSDGVMAQSLGGNGNGNINVLVQEGATVSGGSGTGQGVRILNGNANTLTNYGTITTANALTVNGIALSSSQGTVTTVDNYGTIAGNIDLQQGLNTLHNFGQGNLYSGSFINLGSDSNAFINSGTLSLGGSGAVQSTILTGSLSMTDTSNYNVDLDGQTTKTDRLDVSGTVQEKGNVNVNLLKPGRIRSGTFAPIIINSQGGITDQGLQLGYQRSAVISYRLINSATATALGYTVDFSPTGLNGNQTQIGDYFNRIQHDSGTIGLAPIVSDIVHIAEVPSLGAAYDQLAPYPYDNTTRAAISFNQMFLEQLQQHMRNTRSSYTLLGKPTKGEDSFWVDGFSARGKDVGVTPTFDFSYHANGGVLGFDRSFTDGNMYGMSIAQGKLKLSTAGNSLEKSSFSLYGSRWLSNTSYLDCAMAYSGEAFSNQRLFLAGESPVLASSSHHGHIFATSLGGGLIIRSGDWSIDTSTTLEYINQKEHAFQETGAGAVNLLVAPRNTTAWFAKVGINATREYATNSGKLVPEIGVSYSRNIGSSGRDITSSFQDFPSDSFTLLGQTLLRDVFAVNAGLNLFTQKGMSFKIGYVNKWYGSLHSYEFSAKFGIKF